MKGISFDLSKKNTGMAEWIEGSLVRTWDKSFTDYSYFGEMLQAWSDYLDAIPWDAFDWVAYEEIRPKLKAHMEIHFGMVGELARRCWVHRLSLFGVNASTAKKLTGRGNATKEQVVAWVNDHYPSFNIETHDEADAVLVGQAAINQMEVS